MDFSGAFCSAVIDCGPLIDFYSERTGKRRVYQKLLSVQSGSMASAAPKITFSPSVSCGGSKVNSVRGRKKVERVLFLLFSWGCNVNVTSRGHSKFTSSQFCQYFESFFSWYMSQKTQKTPGMTPKNQSSCVHARTPLFMWRVRPHWKKQSSEFSHRNEGCCWSILIKTSHTARMLKPCRYMRVPHLHIKNTSPHSASKSLFSL